MYLSFFDELLKANEFNIFIRILVAIILGVALGLCKEIFVKPSGFRVSVITSISSCLITLVGVYALNEALSSIIGGVLVMSGLMTLGIINNNRGEYNGIVNASIIIISTVIGVTCGSGLFFAAICTTLLTALVLFVLKTVEKSMITKGYLLNIIIDSRTPVLKELLYIFDNNHLTTTSIESKIVLYERNECVKIRVEFNRGTSKLDIERVMPLIKEQINPLSITLRNDTYGVIK